MQLRVAWGGEAEEENEPVEMSHVEDAFSEFMRLVCQHEQSLLIEDCRKCCLEFYEWVGGIRFYGGLMMMMP